MPRRGRRQIVGRSEAYARKVAEEQLKALVSQLRKVMTGNNSSRGNSRNQ